MLALKLLAAALLAAGCAMMDSQPTSGPLKVVSDAKLIFPDSVGCDFERLVEGRHQPQPARDGSLLITVGVRLPMHIESMPSESDP